MGIWQRAGKPDHAEVARWFYRMSPDLRYHLNRSEERMLIWALFLVWKSGVNAGRDVNYTFVSQLAWAKKYGMSRWTAARALDRLAAYGLITTTKRIKTKAGEWKPRLVFLTDKLKAVLHRLFSTSFPKAPGCKTAPQECSKHTHKAGDSLSGVAASQDKGHPDGNDAGNEKLRAWAERWGVNLSGSGVPA